MTFLPVESWHPGRFSSATNLLVLDRPIPIRDVRREGPVLLFQAQYGGGWDDCAAVLVKGEDGTYEGTMTVPGVVHIRNWDGRAFEWAWADDGWLTRLLEVGTAEG